MQFLRINEQTTFSDLVKKVGSRNVDILLAKNNMTRTPQVGKELSKKMSQTKSTIKNPVSWQKKSSVLNTFTQDSDIFEEACVLGEEDWKVLSTLGTFPNMLKIPETMKIPDDHDLLGNGVGVNVSTYKNVMKSLKNAPHVIDLSVFNTYSSTKDISLVDKYSSNSGSTMLDQWFRLPWGDITLHSSLDDSTIDFPVYPEELSDGRSATYTEMPDLLYQYEPWYAYQNSGPRSLSLTFKMHRDMWSGDHRDGKCNQLVRFCEACCYPEYNGSAVNTTKVTMYIKGEPLISGILTKASPRWSGPIGLDGFYLECELSLEITEVADSPLSYNVVKRKGLIH